MICFQISAHITLLVSHTSTPKTLEANSEVTLVCEAFLDCHTSSAQHVCITLLQLLRCVTIILAYAPSPQKSFLNDAMDGMFMFLKFMVKF